MSVIQEIAAFESEMRAWRRDFHAHPELGLKEVRTAGIVAEKLRGWGIETHENVGKTGVVGVLSVKGDKATPEGEKAIGLRADMDALSMEEETGLPYSSQNPGCFHGCGHDGHTAMLLGAARYLAETRNFKGKVVFIFQPGEEGAGGARAMLDDGLFDRFPCNEIYALHNWPSTRKGSVQMKSGPAMAGADFFDIQVEGKGAHASTPEASRDPIIAASFLVQALQSIVSRNVFPLDAAVLSVTQFHAGSAYNVIPERAILSGTTRYFSHETRELLRDRMRRAAVGIEGMFDVKTEVKLWQNFDILTNAPFFFGEMQRAAQDVVGVDMVEEMEFPRMGSEDFSDMLRIVPGAYCWLMGGFAGSGEAWPLHHPRYDFDDDLLPLGSSILARIAERRLQP